MKTMDETQTEFEVDETLEEYALCVSERVDPDRTFEMLWKDTPQGALARKICFTLEMYPHVSPTMLQNSLSPQVRAGTWKPILNLLKDAKLVREYQVSRQAPSGHYRTYTILCLNWMFGSRPQVPESRGEAA